MAPLPPAQTPPSTERLSPPATPHGDRAAPPAPPLRRPSSALFDEDLHAALLGAEFSEISLRVARDPRASEALEAARASARRRLEPGDAPRPVARQGSLESLDLAVNGRQQQRLSVISQLRAPPRQEGLPPAPLAAVGPSEGSEASCGGEGESCDGEGASERTTTSAHADAKPKRWFGLRRRPVVVEASPRLTGGSRKHPSPRGSCSTGGRFSCGASSSVAPNQVSPQGQAPFAAQRINEIPEIQLRQPGATEGAAVVPPGAKVLPLTGRLPLPTTDPSTDELTPRTLRKKVLVGERVARARAQRPSLLARSSITGTSAGGAARHSGTMHALDLSLYAEQKEELDAIFNEGIESPQQEAPPRLDQPVNRLAQTVEEMRSVELGLQLAEMEQQISSDPRAMEAVAAAHIAKFRLGASRSRADLFSQSADGSGAPVFTRLLSFRDAHADAGSGDPSAARQGSLDGLCLFVSETQQQQVDTLSELRRQRSLRMHKDSEGAPPPSLSRTLDLSPPLSSTLLFRSTPPPRAQDLDTGFIGRANRQWRRPSLNGTERAKVAPLLDGAELGAACSDAPPRRRGSSDATWRARIAPGGNADEPSVEPREDAPTRVFPSCGETDASGSTRRQSLARSLVKRRSSTAPQPAPSRQSGASRQSKSEAGLTHISGWVELGLELADAGLDAQEEAMLDYDSLQSLKAARVLRAKQANVARIRQQASATGPPPKRSSDGVGQWLSFGLELAAAEWEEGEEALLDPQSRASLIAGRVLQRRGSGRLQSPRKPTGWLDFGLELADANADMEEELELSALSRAAASAGRLLRTRHSSRLSGIGDLDSPRRPAIAPLWRDARRRIDSYERNSMIESFRITRRDTHESPRARHSAASGAAPRPSSWLGFGLELAHAALDAEEEAELEPQTRQSLAAGRALLARGERPAAVDAGWLGLGAFLLDAGLDAEQEAALDGQARAALGASRVIRGKRGGGARAAEASAWYGLGLELLDAGVTAEVEASLDAHSRAAVKAVRWLLERRESEASGGEGQAVSSCNASDLLTFNPGEKLPSAKETAEAEALPAEQRPTGRGRARSAPHTSWLAFGLEIDALQLSAEEEAHLDGLSRAALGAVRELSLHPPLQADGSPPIEEQEALLSRSQAAVRRLRTHLLSGSGEALDSPAEAAVAPHGHAAPLTWVQLGAELMEAALPAEEEAALDPQAKAALRVARARRAAAEGAAAEGAWADLALELAALAPNGEEEAALDLRARRALREIRAPLVEAAALRGGGTCCAEREAAAEGRRSAALRRDGGGLPMAEDEAAPDGPRRRGGSAWVEWGLELAELQLDAEEEAALDNHSRAALSAARMVRARGLSAAAAAGEAEAEGGVDAHRTARGGRGEEASFDAEAESGVDSHRRSVAREAGGAVYGRWAVGGGRVESCGSHVECAAAPHARRVARDRPRLISMGLGGGVAEELEGEAVVEPHASRAPPRAWLRFGLELQGLGLSAEEEAALEPQARAALRVACMLYPPLPPSDEEALLPQRRAAATGGAPLVSMACDASVLGSEESEAMPSQSQKGRRPTAGRLIPMGCDASVVGGEESEAMPLSQKRRPTAGRLVPMGCDASGVGGEESEAMPSSQRRRPTAGRLAPTGCDASVMDDEESEAMPSSQRRRSTAAGFVPMGCDASVVGGEESEAMPSHRRRSTAAGFVPMGCDASVVGGEESEAMPSQRRRSTAAGFVPMGCDASVVGGEESEAMPSSQGRRPTAGRLVPMGCDASVASGTESEAIPSQGRRPTAGRLVPMGCDASGVGGEESEAVPSQGRRRTAGRLVPMGCDASGVGGEESEAMPSQERRPTAGRLVPMGCDASGVGGEESEAMPSRERRPTAGRLVSMGCDSIAGSCEVEAAAQPHAREGALPGGSLLLHGFALLDAGVEDEAALDPQSRAALGAARIVRQRGAESRGEVAAPAASATVTPSPCGRPELSRTRAAVTRHAFSDGGAAATAKAGWRAGESLPISDE
ncbi:hypothetical protein AB1Y20_013513 [Prymnesium parvum]|uniref:Uncharacterized protein n=1 Tax=Prymnesium parvum TaxID=97485 RepID=A0AB34IFS4_PRYPA